MKTVFFSLALVGIMVSCDRQSSITPAQSSDQSMAYQKSVRLGGTSLELKVAQVVDSRCPINARCITAGSVKVFFEASEQGATQAVEVDLPAYPDKAVDKPFTINGQAYRLNLREVLPYPEAGKAINLSDYTVQVSVEKQ